MFFSVIIKTLNWEILNTNLVTFKKSDFFWGGIHEKPIYWGGGDFLKRGP